MQAVCSTSASTFKGLALPRRAPRTGAWPLQLKLLIVSSSSAWAGLIVLNIYAGVAAARPVLSGEQPTPGQATKDPRMDIDAFDASRLLALTAAEVILLQQEDLSLD